MYKVQFKYKDKWFDLHSMESLKESEGYARDISERHEEVRVMRVVPTFVSLWKNGKQVNKPDGD